MVSISVPLRVRTLGSAAALAAVAIAAAGCSGQSATTASGASASEPGVTTSPSPTAALSTDTGSQTPTSGTTSASTSSSGNPACGNHDLKTSEGRAGAGMSHQGVVLIFTNVSGHACTLQGYPGVAITVGTSVVANATRTLSGYLGDGNRQLTAPPLLTLAPGAPASAMLEWEANAGQACYPNGNGTLKVTPPNTTATVSIGSTQVGSNGVCAALEVHPVVTGIISG